MVGKISSVQTFCRDTFSSFFSCVFLFLAPTKEQKENEKY